MFHLTEGRKRLFATTTPQVFKCSYLDFTLKLILETNQLLLGKHRAGREAHCQTKA